MIKSVTEAVNGVTQLDALLTMADGDNGTPVTTYPQIQQYWGERTTGWSSQELCIWRATLGVIRAPRIGLETSWQWHYNHGNGPGIIMQPINNLRDNFQ